MKRKFSHIIHTTYSCWIFSIGIAHKILKSISLAWFIRYSLCNFKWIRPFAKIMCCRKWEWFTNFILHINYDYLFENGKWLWFPNGSNKWYLHLHCCSEAISLLTRVKSTNLNGKCVLHTFSSMKFKYLVMGACVFCLLSEFHKTKWSTIENYHKMLALYCYICKDRRNINSTVQSKKFSSFVLWITLKRFIFFFCCCILHAELKHIISLVGVYLRGNLSFSREFYKQFYVFYGFTCSLLFIQEFSINLSPFSS